MTDTIRSFAELQAALQALPAPAPGRIRVFRGQTADYGSMTPTALRAAERPDMIWPLYAGKLADALGHGRRRDADDAEDAEDADVGGTDLDTYLLWVRAIKQHYGPGTEFLDVTHSPGVAAWFALHDTQIVTVRAAYGPPGPFNPHTDVYGEHDFVKHVAHRAVPGWLYVFDAIDGTGAGDLEHGTVFDLALAPEVFSSSTRIRAQQACLLHADREVDGGDLSAFYVPGTPLRIGWPLEGCAEVGWTTNDLFPPAPEDAWYAKFVAVPLAPDLPRSTERTVYAHPINVTLYLPQGTDRSDDERLLEDLTYRFVTQHPPLLFATLLEEAATTPAGDQQEAALAAALGQATALLLEGPMMSTIAPVSKLNRGLLATSLADAAPCRDLVAGSSAGTADLTNVFVELSALDSSGWELAGHAEGEWVLRGLWLRREGGKFSFAFWADGSGHALRRAGPVAIAHLASGTWAFIPDTAPPGSAGTPLEDIPELERAFVKALSLVRSLGPRWKLSASAQYEMDDGGDRMVSFANVEWALGEIVRLDGLAEPLARYHVLRQWGTDEPYYGGARPDSPAIGGALRVHGEPYALVDPSELLQAAAELAQRPPPF